MNMFFAQVNVDSILNSSLLARQALDEIWSYLGSSALYEVILNLTRLLLGAALIFYAYQIYRRILDDLDYRPLIPLIIVPLIFMLLLGNPRIPANSPIWNLSVQLRNTIYWFDSVVMSGLLRDADLREEIRVLQVDNLTRAEAEADLQRCSSLADPEEQRRCRNERLSISLASIAIERSQALGQRRTASSNWFDAILSALNQVGNVVSLPFRGLGDIIVDALGVVIVVMSNLFNYCIEAGFVVTAIVAPFAVAFSLFPLPTKPIYTWLIGYMGLGLWKIGTDILAGIGAYVMNRTDDFSGFNYIMFSLLVGLFAPVIAGGFSSFSALSISQGFTQGTSQVVQQTLKTVGVVTGLGAFVATRGR